LKLRKVLDSGAAADWFEQVLEGVKAAHTAGVIHRDLKPENILIEECSGGARIKILDFGLAKVAAEEAGETRLTASGIVVGTFGYMAPEQIIGGHVDERSDIFALGIMAAEALTGERPFKGATYEEMLVATFRGGARLRGNSREVRALDAILQRCLATDPSGRYQSVAELQRDLIPALRTCPLIETTATANG
jgi:serine/threonine-protein kinase